MEYEGYLFFDDLLYEKNHFWCKMEGDLVVMGATEFISKQAGEITFVDLPEEDDDVIQGKPFGSIESGKWVGPAKIAFDAEVIEVNDALAGNPKMANGDPYGEGWLVKVRPEDPASATSGLTPGSAVADPYEAKMAADEFAGCE